LQRVERSFDDKRLGGKHHIFIILSSLAYLIVCAELVAAGIGIHHAGLSMNDRRAVEDLYMKLVLKVIIATSVRH
jgi:hypothetical protein